MTKAEYMDSLIVGLKDVDESISKEIIDDCELHFTNGLAFGKTESELCEELGDVSELIAGCIEMTGDGSVHQGKDAMYDIVKSLEENPVCRCLSIETKNIEGKIVPSKDNRIHIILEGNSDEYYGLQESYEDNQYSVKVVRKKDISFLVPTGLWVKLKVELPLGMYKFMIKTTNGMVTMEDMCMHEIQMHTTNGALIMTRIKTDRIVATSKNGAVKISNSMAEVMDVSTTNGAVVADNVYFKRGRFNSKAGCVKVVIDAQDKEYIAQVSTKIGHTRVKEAVDIFKIQEMGLKVDDCIHVIASSYFGSVDIRKK